MAQAGKQSTAGQEIRLADIEADAGAGMGIFETLHGYHDAASLAVAIKEASAKYHGATGKEWLRYLVANRASLVSILQDGNQAIRKRNSTGECSRAGKAGSTALCTGCRGR